MTSIAYIIPNAAGDTTDWGEVSGCVTHYLCVDDPVGADDGYGTCIREGYGPHLDLFKCNDPGLTGKTINSVTIHNLCRDNGDGKSKVRTAIKTGGTVYYATQVTPIATLAFGDYTYVLALNPKTGLAWTGEVSAHRKLWLFLLLSTMTGTWSAEV